MKEKVIGLAVGISVCLGMAIPALGGTWDSDENGWWYVDDYGSYPKSQAVEIDGYTYGFDSSGYMVSGWYDLGGRWYYFSEETGAALTGWQQIGDNWYYLEPAMRTGWLYTDTDIYYFEQSGAMVTGWFEVSGDNHRYRAHEDGRLYKNEKSTEDGISFKYQGDGTILYRSENTSKLDDEAQWYELLVGSEQTANVEYQQELLVERVFDIKSEAVTDYYSDVLTQSGTKRTKAKTKWEKNTREDLADVDVDEDEIDKFIKYVYAGKFIAGYDEDIEDDDYDDDDD